MFELEVNPLKENILVNEILKNFNITNIDIEKLTKKNEKKKRKITINYFLGNLLYMIKMLTLQLLLVSLPLSPILELVIMIIVEVLYIAFNANSYFVYNNFESCVVLFSRLSQSSILLFIYIHFLVVFRKGVLNEEFFSIQSRCIFLISVGVALEYLFLILMLILMVIKKIKERRMKRERERRVADK